MTFPRAAAAAQRLIPSPTAGPIRGPIPAYDAGARAYDQRTAAFQAYRQRILDVLAVGPGDVVLDVGCGTGLCFGGLEDKIGPAGHIVAIDESPAMLQLATQRATTAGWSNITFIESSAEYAVVDLLADAALFCAVHDVLQSPAALRTVFGHLKPGAHVVAGGGKFTTLMGLNVQVAALHRPYIRSFDGFRRPWRLLERFLTDLTVTEFAYGTGFVAEGRVPMDEQQYVSHARPGERSERTPAVAGVAH
jgi:precorrin-6B methylase 2